MKTSNRVLALTSALLLGIAILPAYALDVNVGGVGVSANTGGGNVASAGATTSGVDNSGGGTNADIIITNSDGSLVDLQNEDDTATGTINLGDLGVGDIGAGGIGGGGTGVGGVGDAEIDLGGLLGGILPGGVGAGGSTVTATQVAASFSGLSGSEQVMLNNKCRSVMIDPSRFDPSLVALCRVIVQIR